jgi:hypothetical protein
MVDAMQEQLWTMTDAEFFHWMFEWSPETEAELVAGLALTKAERERRPRVQQMIDARCSAFGCVLIDAMGTASGGNSKH